MANHKSALKRIRQNEKRRALNSYYHKTMRNALRALRSSSDKKEVAEMLPKVESMIDRLSKSNVIHKNKAANLKSSITKYATAL
jgi:small subunit ribosomal protein S20